MKKVAALVLAFAACSANAANNEGYLQDQSGNVVKSGTGLCWKTGYWTPAMANQECDPSITVKEDEKAVVQEQRVVAYKKELNADVLFDFDKFAIKAAGKAELDQIAKQINTLRKVDFVLVIGHADRIGKEGYNLALSKKRANEVRKYLISKGVDASVIRSSGVGESQPLTKPGECSGKGAKLRACLAKDRRVEIQVNGTN